MNTDQIKCFLEVAKYNNFTKAAQRLYINQSTVSRQIADLEKELGARLFARSGGNVELTEAGGLFVREGNEILRRYEFLKEKITAIGNGKGGKLAVGLPLNVFGMNHGFSPAELANENPDTEFKFVMSAIDEINTALVCGDIDVGVTYDFAVKKFEEELTIKPIRKRPFVFFVGERNNVPDKLGVGDLITAPLVLLKGDYQPPFLASIISKAAYDGSNDISFCQNYESMLMEVSVGMGIGVLPELIFEQAKQSYKLRRIEVEEISCQINYIMAFNKKNMNPMINTFYKFFVKHFS